MSGGRQRPVCGSCEQPLHGTSCTSLAMSHAWLVGQDPAQTELGILFEPGDCCGMCGALAGGRHHIGCTASWCSVCGDQAVFCEHFVPDPWVSPN